VLSRNLPEMQGRYLQPGDEFCSIGNRDQLGAKALIEQDDATWLERATENEVTLLVWGEHRGPLNVVSKNEVEGNGEAGEMLLTWPHVSIDLTLNSPHLASGQTGLMYLKARQQNLGSYLFASVRQFFQRNLVKSHGL